MILVDFSVWIDDFRNLDTPQVALLDSLFGRSALAVGDLIAAEVLASDSLKAQQSRWSSTNPCAEEMVFSGRSAMKSSGTATSRSSVYKSCQASASASIDGHWWPVVWSSSRLLRA